MNEVEKLYRWLSTERSNEANRVLAAALERAEPVYAARIAAILLQRKNETAWAGLVANYDRLNADARRQMQANPELLRAAAATALTSRTERERVNALNLLGDQSQPQLAYLLVDGLRDPSPRIRETSARVICAHAERFLSAPPPRDQAAADADAERADFISSLREALRTFELHQRRDVLQVCLWFAKDLGDTLWEALAAPRSQCALVVDQHLQAWNHPRLAGFLLLALARPAWRKPALAILNSWNSRRELLAIVKHSDVLGNAEITQQLALIRQPRWFAAAGATLADLPRYAQAQIPHWLCYLGFTSEQRVAVLRKWHASPLPEVRRAATYALAALGTPEAVAVLAAASAGSGPLQRFARWYVAGATLVSARPARETHGSALEASW